MKKICLLISLLFLLITTVNGQIFPDDLLQGKKKLVIAFEYRHHFIVIPVRFQGILPLQFIYDTGSEYTILFKKEYTDIMGMSYQKRIPILGADQGAELNALICRNVMLQVGEVPQVNQDILVLEQDLFNLEQLTGTPIDGILGTNFFRNFIVEINYKRHQLIIRHPQGYEAPGAFEEIPVHFKNNKPYTFSKTEVFRDTMLNVELLFDTGAGLPLLLHNNTHPGLRLPEKTITGRIGMGLGGQMRGYIGRIHHLDMGPFDFDGLITSFQDLEDPLVENETKSRNGLIGNQLLSKFTVILDFPRNRMYLKPNRFFRKKIRFDKSGMTLFAVGPELKQYLVQGVVEGSPADRAGILPGDKITRFGWWPASWYSLDGITFRLQRRTGKRISMELLRGGETIKKVFYLQDLL